MAAGADAIGKLRDLFSIRMVYAEPIEREGTTVIPAAVVIGGGGGGSGSGEQGSGEGLGFGLVSRPVGAYVIRDGRVRWVPAIDPFLVFLAGVALLGFIRKIYRQRRST